MAGERWHHLQLIDNLESDNNCQLCRKPVLGSRGYKCGKYGCSFIIHESCPKDHKIEATHGYSRDPHHLISMKEVEKNGDEKKVVVCSLCEEPVSSLLRLGNNNLNNNGPSSFYKCSFPNCTFLIHTPCALLPAKTTTHPLHFSDHELRLRGPTETQNRCGACLKVFSKRFYYQCIDCDYMLDIKCDSRWRTSVDKCNEHALFPIRNPIQFTCEDSKMAGRYWHHLQLIDNLESRGDCWLCEEPVLGSRGYKCGECTYFVIHESCPIDHKIEAEHDLSDRHHLISMKEVEKNGDEKKVVVCSLCEEPVSSLLRLGNNNINNNGPSSFYKCSFPNCTFLIHQPCALLLFETTHPLHFSDHELRLKVPNKTQYCCGACGKFFSQRFFYGCITCDYRLHVTCASRWQNINVDKCNPHPLGPIRDLLEFTCKACGVKRSDFASHCSNCLILIHTTCVKFIGTIKIRGHGHSLTCTFSLNQVKKHKCEVCDEEVDTKYAAYCCDDQNCDYIAHLQCAYWIRKESEASDSIDYVTHLVEGSNLKEDEKTAPQEIQHLSHPQHKLILINEELLDVKRCEGCMQFIVLVPFYDCAQCNYSLHIRCTKLPQEVMRPRHHRHPLTLHNVDSKVQSFRCWACDRTRSGFSYRCVKCSSHDGIFDAQCILIPEVFKHKGHLHYLFLGEFDRLECNACGQRPYGARTFDCTTCGFHLCIKCATLPLITRHRYDTHLLYLTYAAEDNSEEHYCQICEEERDRKLWFYYCKICDFAAHPQCIFGRTFFN